MESSIQCGNSIGGGDDSGNGSGDMQPEQQTLAEPTTDSINTRISLDSGDELLPLKAFDDLDCREHEISSGSEVSTVSELNGKLFLKIRYILTSQSLFYLHFRC